MKCIIQAIGDDNKATSVSKPLMELNLRGTKSALQCFKFVAEIREVPEIEQIRDAGYEAHPLEAGAVLG